MKYIAVRQKGTNMEKKESLNKARYDPELLCAAVFQILMYGRDFSEELRKRGRWLTDHPVTEKDSSDSWIFPLITSKPEQALMSIRTAQTAETLRKITDSVWEVFDNLPEAYRDILNELCIEKYTWNYLRTTKYLSNRRIKRMKDEALKAVTDMMGLLEEPGKEI